MSVVVALQTGATVGWLGAGHRSELFIRWEVLVATERAVT